MRKPSVDVNLPVRGVHIDCRAQMLRFPRLLEIFHDLARWGYNAVLLEYEDHFPYRGRLKSIAAEDALTPAQVRELDRVAHQLGLQIIPLLQCLGHLTYVLRLPRFRRLAEGYPRARPYAVCPAEPQARALYHEMVSQVLEYHPDSRYFHIGGDEVSLQANCPRCRRQNPSASLSERLVNHYLDRADWVRRQGPDPIIWCDMALAHPEQIERLRGRVIIMDWDYWSGLKATRHPLNLWGVRDQPKAVMKDPRTWAPLHRELFKKHFFTAGGKSVRPFPYAGFLHDQGFPFMIAPAARCHGDSFCAPLAPKHPDNVVGAARAAVANRSLGYVITSWALRRSPWPLTEYTLLAGSLALKNPLVKRREVDLAFVREHFGSNDTRLARIPFLLGVPVPHLLLASPSDDLLTNRWLAQSVEQRLEIDRRDPGQTLRQLRRLRANCAMAARLLASAKPRTARQKERVALWDWAVRVLAFYSRLAPAMLKGEKPVEALKEMRSLSALSQRLLGRLYTDRTMMDEQQNRFGSLEDFLKGRS